MLEGLKEEHIPESPVIWFMALESMIQRQEVDEGVGQMWLKKK